MENNKATPEQIKEAPINLIEEAKKVRDEIRAENTRREQILATEQALQAEKMLAGTAGGRPPEQKQDTPKEYAEKVMRGIIKAK